MIRITKQEKEALEEAGLIRYRRQYGNRIVQDSNIVVTNREHVGKNVKTYYIVEEPEIMKFLGYYDNLNLQKINDEQFNLLMEKGLVDENKIQHWGEYKPRAVCYQDQYGEYRIVKVTQLMLALGLWKTNKQRRIERDMSKNDIPDAGDYAEAEADNEFADLFKSRF